MPLPNLYRSIASTLFISIVPIFLIYILNKAFLTSPALRESVIYYLISFAIGGLLGDVFFHTLPHMSSGHSHDHSHENLDHSHHHLDHNDHTHGHHGHTHDP